MRTYQFLSSQLIANIDNVHFTNAIFAIAHVALFDMTIETFLMSLLLIFAIVIFAKITQSNAFLDRLA